MMLILESYLVLHCFKCNQFGYIKLREMLKQLDGLSKSY